MTPPPVFYDSERIGPPLADKTSGGVTSPPILKKSFGFFDPPKADHSVVRRISLDDGRKQVVG
jgi:hypothetical protein